MVGVPGTAPLSIADYPAFGAAINSECATTSKTPTAANSPIISKFRYVIISLPRSVENNSLCNHSFQTIGPRPTISTPRIALPNNSPCAANATDPKTTFSTQIKVFRRAMSELATFTDIYGHRSFGCFAASAPIAPLGAELGTDLFNRLSRRERHVARAIGQSSKPKIDLSPFSRWWVSPISVRFFRGTAHGPPLSARKTQSST